MGSGVDKMTREMKEFLVDLIDRELEQEEQCDMLYHKEYISKLIRVKKELLRGLYKGQGLMGAILYSSRVEDDVKRYLLEEDE